MNVRVTAVFSQVLDLFLHPSLREGSFEDRIVARVMVALAWLLLLDNVLPTFFSFGLLLEGFTAIDTAAFFVTVASVLLSLVLLRFTGRFRSVGLILTFGYLVAMGLYVIADSSSLSPSYIFLPLFPVIALMFGGVLAGVIALLLSLTILLMGQAFYPAVIPSVYGDSLEAVAVTSAHSVMAVLGTLFVVAYSYHYIQQSMQMLLKQRSFDLEKANQVLRDLSSIDGLTKLFNRHYLEENYTRAWSTAIKEQQPLTVVMMDVDHFKPYNDNYGHLQGDECLKQLADTLRESVTRPTDFVVRYGGEEFLVILPNTDLAGGEEVMKHIQKSLKKKAIKHEHSSAGDVLTLSAGIVSAIPQQEEDKMSLIKQADEALYHTKQNGRDGYTSICRNR